MHMCICIAHKMVLYFISVHLFLKPFSCIGNLRGMLTGVQKYALHTLGVTVINYGEVQNI